MYRAGKDAKKWEFPVPVARNGLATTFLENNRPMPTAYACARSCPTLCDPVDCGPPGPSVHGISQARILKWVANPFSRGSSRPRDQTLHFLSLPHWQVGSLPLGPPGKPLLYSKVKSLSHVRLFATPWTVAHQAPQSMEFSRQEYWSGLPFPLQGTFPTQGLNPGLPHCRPDALLSEPPGKPLQKGLLIYPESHSQ